MDGTLLDLHYDNHMWDSLLPTWYAEANDLTEAQAKQQLAEYMQRRRGSLDFYCLDTWQQFTQVDMHQLHLSCAELVQFRPGAKTFLRHWQATATTTILVTNAHRLSLTVKDQYCGISALLDAVVSCHDYGAPKESQEFWHCLQDQYPFDPARTLFIDDNPDVLASAEQYGIAQLRMVTHPDSQRSAKPTGHYLGVNNLATLLPTTSGDGP